MAKTLTNFLTYIKYDFKRDDKDTEITQALNDTIRSLANMKALEGRKFTSYIATTADQEDYPLPTSKAHIIHPVRYIEASDKEDGYSLEKLSREEWTKRYINPNNSTPANISTGAPVAYCIYENAIHLGPVPDKSTYLIEMDWSKIPTAQAAGGDIQELGEEWEEVIKWGVLFRLYAALGLDDEAAKWKALFEDDKQGFPALLRNEEANTGKMEAVEYRDL